MSSLNIYYQDFGSRWQHSEDYKNVCSQSDFDIVCTTHSLLHKHKSDIELVNTDMFDIFRLVNTDNVKKNYYNRETFIAVRKHLSAYVRREWMADNVKCVWITVPSRGCRSRLHVACMNYSSSININPFIETLTTLRITYTNDKFLIVGRFPLFQGDWISEKHHPTDIPKTYMTDKSEDLVIKGLSASLAGLGQYNNIKDKDDYLRYRVFSSVPVTVTHCQRLLASEKEKWNIALHFGLDIGPPECCKAQADFEISGDLSEFIDGLVQEKWDDLTELLPELISEKFEQTVKKLKPVQELLKTLEGRALAVRETTCSTGAGGFGTSVSSFSNLFGGIEGRAFGAAAPSFSFTQPQTMEFDGDIGASAICSRANAALTTTSSEIIKATIGGHPITSASETVLGTCTTSTTIGDIGASAICSSANAALTTTSSEIIKATIGGRPITSASETVLGTCTTSTTIGSQTFEREFKMGIAGVTFSAASIFGENDTTSTSTQPQISTTTLCEPAARAAGVSAAASTIKPLTLKAALVSSSASDLAAITVLNKPATVGSEVTCDTTISSSTISTFGVAESIESTSACSLTTLNETESIPRCFQPYTKNNVCGELATNPDSNTTTENNTEKTTWADTTTQKRQDSASSSESTACADIGAQDSVCKHDANFVTKHTQRPGDHVGETPDRRKCWRDIEQNSNTTELQTMVDLVQKLILNVDYGNGVHVTPANDSQYTETNNEKYAFTCEVRTATEICNKHLVDDNTTSATDDDDGMATTNDTRNRKNENSIANADKITRKIKRSNEKLFAQDSAPTSHTGEGVAASNDSINRETGNQNTTTAKIETTTKTHIEKENFYNTLLTTNTSDTIVSINDESIKEIEKGSANIRHENAITSEIVIITEINKDKVNADDNASNVDTTDGVLTNKDKSI